MRIPRTWIEPMAERILGAMKKEQLIITESSDEELSAEIAAIVTKELMIEDRINEEVREILKAHEGEIDKGRLDYRRLFDMTKKKLVQDKDVIL